MVRTRTIKETCDWIVRLMIASAMFIILSSLKNRLNRIFDVDSIKTNFNSSDSFQTIVSFMSSHAGNIRKGVKDTQLEIGTTKCIRTKNLFRYNSSSLCV